MRAPSTHEPGWYPDPQGGPAAGVRWWDGNEWTDRTGPAQQGYGAPAKKKRVWPKVLLGVTVLFLLLIVGCVAVVSQAADKVVDDIEENDAEALADVGAPSCTAGVIGVNAAGGVTNGSSKRSDYSIEVKAVDGAGVQLGTGIAFVPNLDAGQRATYEALIPGVPAGTEVRCELVDVTRFASQ